jgi:hypothetical protein
MWLEQTTLTITKHTPLNILFSCRTFRKDLLGWKKETGGTEQPESRLLITWKCSKARQGPPDVECGSMEIFSQMMRIALLLREKPAVAVANKCIGISKLYHIDILRQNDSSYRQ